MTFFELPSFISESPKAKDIAAVETYNIPSPAESIDINNNNTNNNINNNNNNNSSKTMSLAAEVAKVGSSGKSFMAKITVMEQCMDYLQLQLKEHAGSISELDYNFPSEKHSSG